MIERIRELETIARRLEPDRRERQQVRDAVMAYTERFLDTLYEAKTYRTQKEKARELRSLAISEEPADIHELLRTLRACVDGPGINPAGPGHLGYIPGGGLYYSSFGDYLAAVTNRYAGVRFASPGAVEMENMLLDWMAELVGYPQGSGGNLTSGGSIANLIGIVTARDAHGLRARDFDRCVVYMTDQVHHCIPKALRVAGLADCVTRYIPLDESYKMVPAELEKAIAEDRAAGRLPWMVVASAGSTDVGTIDPLEAIGRIAKSNGLWYHIDAAYGGFFALCDECRPRLAGMELSDSIVLDPHKGLFLPYGSGALLVKDREALYRAHHHLAPYMQDALAEESIESGSPADMSPELSKHFRGPRLWLPLMLHGLAPFRAALREKLLLTRYFHEEVRKLGFEVGPEPELTVATYRYVPASGDADAFNKALVDAIHRDGRIFISSTSLDGSFVLRLAVLCFRTHLDTIELALEILKEKVGSLTRAGHGNPGARRYR